MSKSAVKLHPSWLNQLADEFDKEYFQKLKEFLQNELKSGKTLYPPNKQIFAALDACPFDKVKVVIIGQDPYHGPNQANGLCFSVNRQIPNPPSLVNIFKELQKEYGYQYPHGDLSSWAEQGVLLLNATLTVEAHKAGSHQNKGWETFTDKIIEKLNDNHEHIVFLLWGGYARKKGKHIDRKKHLVLETGHPSPLSANRGLWFGNQHFTKCNSYLEANNISPIDWSLKD